MSFLIKGMDMPKEGGVIVIYKEGNNFYTTKAGEGKRYPLIPIPSHGRLIDADALYNVAFERSEKKDGYYNCLEPVISCYTIEHAPTIISAEEEE